MVAGVVALKFDSYCITCTAWSIQTGAWTPLHILPVFLGILSCIWISWHSFLPVLLIFSLHTAGIAFKTR